MCLESILHAVRALDLEGVCEFVLMDDDSDPRWGVGQAFAAFRKATAAPMHIARFRKWQHYTGVFAYGLSRATGHNVLFISNDMQVTPDWLRTLLAVAALDPSIGIVRGVAEIVDSHPEHCVKPPFEDRGLPDVLEFSAYMARALGMRHGDDKLLSGDAVLIRRALIEKIGVMDRRFFGYFGDPDYGIRARRAGFRLVCAKGAWIKHFGAGHLKAEQVLEGKSVEKSFQDRMALVQKGYELFRMKWDPAMPETFTNTFDWDWDRFLKVKKPAGFDYVAPVPVDPGLVEVAV